MQLPKTEVGSGAKDPRPLFSTLEYFSMKKTLIALAAVAATGAAFAQSSVTMFGIVDIGVTSIDQGDERITSVSNEGQASNRLGFRGVEDLGGGMRASFWLEGGFSADTGVGAGGGGGFAFNRRATLGLSGGFGEVRLGRDYTPTFYNHSAYTVFGTNGLGNSLNTFTVLGSGATTGVRADNAVSYFTPTIAGFQGQLMVSAKESAASNTPNEYVGARVVYNAGPLSASLATASEGSNIQTESYKRTNLGATYDFGMAKLWLFYNQGKFGALKDKQLALGVTAPVGPGTVKASYLKADVDNSANGANHITLGYDYPLSKRTVVYGVFSRVTNDGASTFSANYAGSGAGAVGVTPGGNSTGYGIGIRHNF
jgi:predicted porin